LPTYGYRCTACSHEFERFQKITDPPVSECESCGGAVKKIIYPVGIQFVGSGFYVNDYAKSNGAGSSGSKSGSSESASSGSTSETKSESKPAETKTETPASAGATSSSK
jgi:putative regulatory protein, FmdB family